MLSRVASYRPLAVLAILPIVVLSSILAGCGASSGTGSSASGNQPGSATVSDVQLNASIDCGLWVVLKSHQQTYSASELGQINTFLDANARPYLISYGINPVNYAPNDLPSTLEYVSGNPSCRGIYEVTNTGKNLVQLNEVGFQDMAKPTKSPEDYHVVDACPYMRICVLSGLGATQPCKYYSDLQMNASQEATALGKLQVQQAEGSDNGPPCPSVINLQAGQTVNVSVSFGLQGNFADATSRYEMKGVPALNITSSAGTKTITYPTLADTVDFLPWGKQGFPGTCYTQKGQTFVPVTSFDRVPDQSKDPELPYYVPVCV
jgi:hypothetical protein